MVIARSRRPVFDVAPGRGATRGRSLARATVGALGVGMFVSVLAANAFAQITLGVMGDSLSDEYAYNGRGYATNWTEQLVNFGGVNLGANVINPAPRNHGYNQNWALSGATSATVLSGGQSTGLAAQIPNAGGYGIDYAVLAIGANDFAPGGSAYNSIYNSAWSAATINNYVNTVVGNVNTALNNVLPTGVKVAVATVPDYGIAPAVQAAYTNASKRQLVANVIAQVNTGIKNIAQTDHIVVADLAAMINATFGPEGAFNTTVKIGNVTINLNQTTGANPSPAGFVSDGIHPNTPLQGVLANLFLQALDTGYNAGVPLFSEAEILQHTGLAYGGSDTLNATIGPYTNFIISYAPTPAGAGDVNNDGIVNGQDVSQLASNWLHIGSNVSGDVNGDGIVNGQDITSIASHWLVTYGGGSGAGAAVPEPAGWLLAVSAGALWMGTRRAKRRG